MRRRIILPTIEYQRPRNKERETTEKTSQKVSASKNISVLDPWYTTIDAVSESLLPVLLNPTEDDCELAEYIIKITSAGRDLRFASEPSTTPSSTMLQPTSRSKDQTMHDNSVPNSLPILQITNNDFTSKYIDEHWLRELNSNLGRSCHEANQAVLRSLGQDDSREIKNAQNTLGFREDLERRTILELQETFHESYKWDFITKKYELQKKLGEEVDPNASTTGLHIHSDEYIEDCLDMYITRLRSHAEIYFHEIFPEGIEGTALSDVDVFNMLEISLGLPTFTDGDLTSCRFPINPGMKLTAENQPPEFLGMYFASMACKAHCRMAKIATVDEWREKVSKYFYHRYEFKRTETRAIRMAVRSMHDMMTIMSLEQSDADKIAEKKRLIEDFTFPDTTRHKMYLHCLDIEAKHLAFKRTSRDDTITVEFQRGEVVGKGGTGYVYRCTNTESGQFLALKELELVEEKEHQIRYEIDTLKRLSHQNIVKYYGCRFDRESKKVNVLMEYLPKNLRGGGELAWRADAEAD